MLLKIKRNYIASGLKRMWQSLYQQDPTPDDGIYFNRTMLRRYAHEISRRNARVYQAWDFAITEKQQNDWTVCATILQDSNDNLFVLNILRFKSDDGNAIAEHMIDNAIAWKADVVGVEDGQIWKTLKSQYEKRCGERRHYTPYEVLQPLTDKLVRASPLKGRMQLGKVWWPTKAPWVEQAIRELMTFPAGKHDDVVDAMAWAVRLTLLHAAPRPTPEKPVKSWKDKLSALGRIGSAGHMAA
jgi:predicted phage terminase large subunit-like protein